MAILETHQLTRRFGELTAADQLTIAVGSGRGVWPGGDQTARARPRSSRC
jgi:hypothetical protein